MHPIDRKRTQEEIAFVEKLVVRWRREPQAGSEEPVTAMIQVAEGRLTELRAKLAR